MSYGAEIWGPAAINAASDAVSGAFNSGQNQGAQRRSRKFTREVMQNQMQWKARDLRRAGLNPMLSISQGAGPSAPGNHGMAPTNASMSTKLPPEAWQLYRASRANADRAEAEASIAVEDAKHRTSPTGKMLYDGQQQNKAGIIGNVKAWINSMLWANDQVNDAKEVRQYRIEKDGKEWDFTGSKQTAWKHGYNIKHRKEVKK